MKKTFRALTFIVAGVAAGAWLHECQSPRRPQPPEAQGYTAIDTIHCYDTTINVIEN